MPTATIELPQDMVDAATSYAARENKSVEDLFFDLLHRNYGFQHMYVMADEKPRATPGKHEISQDLIDIAGVVSISSDKSDKESSWLDKLHPKVRSLVGSLRLSPEDASKSYDDLRDEYFAEKYREFL